MERAKIEKQNYNKRGADQDKLSFGLWFHLVQNAAVCRRVLAVGRTGLFAFAFPVLGLRRATSNALVDHDIRY